MNAWSELPNAKHIDWVLESIRSNHDIWIHAWIRASEQAYEQAYEQARNQASGLARRHVWKQAYDQIWEEQARYQGWNQSRVPVYTLVSSILLALVVYDDCDQYLSMTIDELKIWAVLSEKPQAVLLLPMKWVQENECLV